MAQEVHPDGSSILAKFDRAAVEMGNGRELYETDPDSMGVTGPELIEKMKWSGGMAG